MSEEKENQNHKIHIAVENFGPIEKAEIDLRPLTVFVGDNNTGKTYLATLIYLLYQNYVTKTLWKAPRPDSNLKCSEAFSNELLKYLNVKDMADLKRYGSDADNRLKILFNIDNNGDTLVNLDWKLLNKVIETPPDIKRVSNEMIDIRESETHWHSDTQMGECTYFLPAARRGIMLTIDTMYCLSVNDESPSTFQHFPQFTPLISDFIQLMSKQYEDNENSPNQIPEIADEFEKDVLSGGIRVIHYKNVDFPQIFYLPNLEDKTIRLSNASSMVSELAPLVMMLRGIVRQDDTLIIEEPEAHLHPRAQTKMAITLARLVRAGVRVIITTHSDWLLEQIGNLVREGEVKKLDENLIEPPTTWLTEEEVGAWRFHLDKPVEELKFDLVTGFEPQDYGEVAEELYNRSVVLRTILREKIGDSKVE